MLVFLSCTSNISNPGMSGDPFIELTSPNGGNDLQVGAPFTIRWEANFSENINIQFYRGLESDVLEMVIQDVPNNGECVITPLFDMPQGTNYIVKVASVQNSSVNDISDSYFEISDYVNDWNNDPTGATILSVPHEGNYAIYNSGDIDWYKIYLDEDHTYYFENSSEDDFDTDFYLYGPDYPYGVSVADDDDTNGLQPYIEYTVPNNESGYYYLRVANYDNNPAKEKQYDVGYYTLSVNSEWTDEILLTSPNGGEVWMKDTGKYISWIDQNSDNVDIHLLKSGFPYITIETSYPNSGNYYWDIPSDIEVGDDYTIIVVNAENQSIYDESDYYFSIIEKDYSK